jgi:hypothetical protein
LFALIALSSFNNFPPTKKMINLPQPITINLTELNDRGNPIDSKGTLYTLQDPQKLFTELVQALDDEQEETFTTEATIKVTDSEATTFEVHAIRFTRHASWGLRGKVAHPTEGNFRFYSEFVSDL